MNINKLLHKRYSNRTKEVEYKMKKTSKKIFVGLMVVMLIVTIGAVVVSAHPFFSELTDDQKQGIKNLVGNLKDEGASREEIRTAMRAELEEYGVEIPTREEMLDKKIEHAEQRLEILKRIKELVQENPEISNEEIREIIQEEFELEIPEGNGQCMKFRGGFRRGSCMPSRGIISNEEAEL